MWYVFKNNKCVSICDHEPDADDIKLQECVAIQSNEVIDVRYIGLADGVVISTKPVVYLKDTQLELRDTLLDETQWIFQRQITGTDSQKMPESDYAAVVAWWAELRDYSQNYTDGLALPKAPECISSIVDTILRDVR
jgi:hypothetical protein